MNTTERKEALLRVQQASPFATGYQLQYKGENKQFDVWDIPLDYLVYNQYNGRIGSVVKSYEKQNHRLSPENPDDAAIIEHFLWESKPSANEVTERSLKSIGQQKFGIVTADGIIIDGNRRASILNRIRHSETSTPQEKARCGSFKAVILPLDAQKADILRLETSYQMGEDAKVDYNPIEKYLKTRDLKESNFTDEEIAEFMGVTKSDVKTNLQILDLIDDYLSNYGYDGIYTMATGHEDSFQKLNAALKSYKNGVAQMWDYQKKDVNELKVIAFDYIRFDIEQNNFRDIIRKPSATNSSIFGSKDIWEAFKAKHQSAFVSEKPVQQWLDEHPGEPSDAVLRARDAEWKRKVSSKFTSNFSDSQETVSSRLQAKEPDRLISKAINAVSSIDVSSPAFIKNKDNICQSLHELIGKVQTILDNVNE